MYFPSDEEKLPLLLGLLSRSEGARTMVFVNTKAWVERVARALERGGYRVGVLSGDVPQKKRESLLAKFQKGGLEILVATDVAARGLHIEGVSHVYNYDLPFDAEDYVHRIGRTARLGAEGDAISFACERYAMSLPDIEAYIEQKLPVARVEPDLLIPRPRAPRAAPAEGEVVEEESIGAIFKEAREQKAADEERRGGRSGAARPSRDGGARRPRGDGPARPRPPRAEPEATAVPTAVAPVDHAAVENPVAENRAAATGDAERAPRKRRRRRAGRPLEAGAENAGGAGTPKPAKSDTAGPRAPRESRAAASPAAHADAPATAKPGFLGRIGRGLKSLVKRAPRSQH